MPAPSVNHLRARAAALQSHHDLLRDQLQFFRENNAVEYPPDADESLLEEQYLAAASRHADAHADAHTDSSVLLPSIAERTVQRRARRRGRNVRPAEPPSAPAFPQSFHVDVSRPSVFARRSKQQHPVQSVPCPTSTQVPPHVASEVPPLEETLSQTHFESASSNVSPLQQASSMLASMSPQQILQAQREIFATLNPDSISFLKQRSFQTANQHARQAHQAPSESARSAGTDQHPPLFSVSEGTNLGVAETKQQHEQLERAKRLWMTDATESIPTQEHVDHILQKAVQDMGPIAKERFDLTGNILTAQQVQVLPTHKGLHHHGTFPESAGYTLADLLILTRSTILSQRVMALKVLTSLIINHGPRVTEPMLKSDGIKLAFSPLPATDTFHSALTNQVAYLEAVECLLQKSCVLDQRELIRDMYFASAFYSPPFVRENDCSLLSVLSELHVITTLIEIAKARCTAVSTVEISKRALNAVRMIVNNSPSLPESYVLEQHSSKPSRVLDMLMQQAVGTDRLAPSTTMLACDIIANIFVKATWVDKDKDHGLQRLSLLEDFLLETAAHLNWAMRDTPFQLNPIMQEAAKGVLRLFRAYLSQNLGVQAISAFLPAICRLAHEVDDNLAVEAYLALEAYVHCLALKAVEASDKQHETRASEKGTRPTQHADEHGMLSFAKDQLAGLTPQVVAAAKLVSERGNRHSTSRRAAAGHFVATTLAVLPIPFDDSYYNQLKCNASEANHKIVISGFDRVRCVESQTLASLSHAIARILNGKLLEKAFVRRETDQLIKASYWEKDTLAKKPSQEGGWRLMANACAEWMGLLSRLECSISVAQRAATLLFCICDVQVILDLISRCVLRKEILLIMGGDIAPSEAEGIARKFIPQAWKILNNKTGSQLPEQVSGDPMHDPVLVSMDTLVNVWMKEDGGTPQGIKLCQSLFKSQLLNIRLFFETLVEVPLTQQADHSALFDLMFLVGKTCVETDGHLIRSTAKTKRSTLSTTTDSQFSTSVMNLADHLVSRGPMPLSASEEKVDSLASIVLSIMCGLEADSTLRINMWTRCVEECGGAALFEHAVFLGQSNLETMASSTSLEKEDIIVRYIFAFTSGFLDLNRSPEIMRTIVLSRLSGYCASPGSMVTLENLFQSLSSVSERMTLEKICQLLTLGGGQRFRSLASWAQGKM